MVKRVEEIRILEGFDRIKTPLGIIPSDQTLIELVQPGTKPGAVLVEVAESKFRTKKELKSLMLLRAENNKVIDMICSHLDILDLVIIPRAGIVTVISIWTAIYASYFHLLLPERVTNLETIRKAVKDFALGLDMPPGADGDIIQRRPAGRSLGVETRRYWAELGDRFPDAIAVYSGMMLLSESGTGDAARIFAWVEANIAAVVAANKLTYKEGNKPPGWESVYQCENCGCLSVWTVGNGKKPRFCSARKCLQKSNANRSRTLYQRTFQPENAM